MLCKGLYIFRKPCQLLETTSSPKRISERIKVHKLDAEVDLLIGTNAPKLLEPWKIVNSHVDGPYAIRTLFGWVENSPLRGSGSDKGKSGCPAVTVSRISTKKVEQLLLAQCNQDVNEKLCESITMLSYNTIFHKAEQF